jgi:hypothetical protein
MLRSDAPLLSHLPQGLNRVITTVKAPTEAVFAERGWLVLGRGAKPQLSFEARLQAGIANLSWKRSSPEILMTFPETEFARFQFPDRAELFISRETGDLTNLSGRSFRLSLMARASGRAVGEVRLRAAQPLRKFLKETVSLTPEWQTFTLSWIVPDTDSKALRLVLSGFRGLEVDVKEVRLEENQEGVWQPLEPLTPSGLSIVLETEGERVEERREVYNAWTSYTVSLPVTNIPAFRRIKYAFAKIGVEPNTTVELRNTELSIQKPCSCFVIPVLLERQHLISNHPNLDAHVLTMLALASLALTPQSLTIFLTALMASLGLLLTASRTAWLSFLGGFIALLLGNTRRYFHFLSSVLLLLVLIFSATQIPFLSNLYTSRLSLFDLTESRQMSRPEIWSYAWSAFLEHPWTGLGPNNFSHYLQSQTASYEFYPSHAHNLWLHFASSYGIFGLCAVLYLTLGLLLLAWRRGGWSRLTLILAIFAMNIFDFTLFYIGLLTPLILALNAFGNPDEVEGSNRADRKMSSSRQ